MLLMVRPDGGQTYIHESRLDEYLAAGFTFAVPPAPPKPAEKKLAKKSTKKR